MSALTDVVLALSPIFFGVLYDELGSTVITDLSGNDNHGTYDPAAIFGQPSPIETDAASRSVGNIVGSIPAPALSQMDLTTNLTNIGFTYYDDVLAATVHLWGRKQQFGQSNGMQAGINGGVISSHVTLDTGGSGTFYPLTDPILPVTGNWYMMSTVRNSGTHALYTNDRLANSRSDLTTDPIIGTGLPWFIGRSENSAAFPGLRSCMLIFFDYALNQAQIASIFQAAINSLFLVGVSNVVPSAILYSDVEPASISAPIRHNWVDPLIERVSFASGISTAIKGYEQANQQRVKPRREIEISQLLKDDYERRMFRAKLNAQQARKWFIPLLHDRERLTTSLSAGATTIATDTQYKCYEVGGYVGVRELNDAGRITTWEEALITALTNSLVTIATPGLVNTYTNPEVYPVSRAILPNEQSLRGHTDSVEDTSILTRLLAEDEKVTPRRIVAWTPTITYKSHEVFDPTEWRSHDWTELRDYNVQRVRSETDFEVGMFSVDSDAIGAGESFTYRTTLETKQKQAELLGWFYARAGSLNYLWVPTMQRDFQILQIDDADLSVQGHNYFENFAGSEYRRDLAFIYHDNTTVLRRIVSVSLDDVNEVLTLNADVPTLSNLRSISYLLFCRLENDTLEIAHITDTKARFAWRFREVLSSPE